MADQRSRQERRHSLYADPLAGQTEVRVKSGAGRCTLTNLLGRLNFRQERRQSLHADPLSG